MLGGTLSQILDKVSSPIVGVRDGLVFADQKVCLYSPQTGKTNPMFYPDNMKKNFSCIPISLGDIAPNPRPTLLNQYH